MADFCKACSEEHFGEDTGDLAGLIPKTLVARGMGSLVLCEGCGPIMVDHEGRCLSKDCLKAGKPGHGPSGEGMSTMDKPPAGLSHQLPGIRVCAVLNSRRGRLEVQGPGWGAAHGWPKWLSYNGLRRSLLYVEVKSSVFAATSPETSVM